MARSSRRGLFVAPRSVRLSLSRFPSAQPCVSPTDDRSPLTSASSRLRPIAGQRREEGEGEGEDGDRGRRHDDGHHRGGGRGGDRTHTPGPEPRGEGQGVRERHPRAVMSASRRRRSSWLPRGLRTSRGGGGGGPTENRSRRNCDFREIWNAKRQRQQI